MAAESRDDEQPARAALGEQKRRTLASAGTGTGTNTAMAGAAKNADADDSSSSSDADSHGDGDGDGDGDDEPKLKYTRLTGSLAPVYRNGDATSTFLVAGDKMIVGTHNGNIHVVSTPSFQALRTYNPHRAASVTALSISPPLPPIPAVSQSAGRGLDRLDTPPRQPLAQGAHTNSPRTPRQPPVPNTPTNQIYVASAAIDGLVCIANLVDHKDILMRNFGRPLQAVALSPEYKSDRSYLSGGLAGELVLTVGGQIGTRSNANTSHASATAQGWLGAIGLGSNSGKDTVLHSGEGTINNIKWSLSGKFVAWVNEHGIRIMRTNLHLPNADSELAWKRIGFIERPNRRVWEDMAGVWKARLEWVEDQWLESDDDVAISLNGAHASEKADVTLPHLRGNKPKDADRKIKAKKVEKLIIGWGDAAWVVHVRPESAASRRDGGEVTAGSAEIIHFLRFDDCIVSGISLYTPSLLIVLAYRTRDDDDNPITETTPKRGVHRRTNGLSPELKLIDAATSDEVEVDSLTISRFESLSAADYHLSTLYVPHPKAMTPAQKNALEAIGGGLWDLTTGAARIFSSGASMVNIPVGESRTAPSVSSASASNMAPSLPAKRQPQAHPNVSSAGLKIFIHSPYDCVLAVKRDLADHFNWELEHENYKDAWELIEDHPEIVAATLQPVSEPSPAATPARSETSLHEFFADDSESQTTISAARANQNAALEKEKRRIGDLWVQQLVNAGNWKEAGKVAGRVLGNAADRWEHWVWIFAQADKIDDIASHMPKTQMKPKLDPAVYELVLGHYIIRDRIRFKHLLEDWDPELFEVESVIALITTKLNSGEVSEETIEGDEQGRDWRILQDALAKLYLARGHQREALRCYIRLQNADAAMALIRDFHLVEAVRDDIPGFILLRVSKEQMESAPLAELEETSQETIRVLVEEGCRGTIPAEDVVHQLQEKGDAFQPFLFFYLRALWRGEHFERKDKTAKERVAADRLAADGQILAESFADLIVDLFAEYDRPLLMEYLRKSQSYDLGKATAICEQRDYIPELVHILSKTGQTKRALHLIISSLSDVSFAIAFAKEQDDPDLWNDLLEYSMDKPHFIRGLLSEVGTAIDPIQLVKRIPEGLQIDGLKDGIGRMVREYEIQYSISEGVARVLRGEVSSGMEMLRAGQKRGVKFEVVRCDDEEEDSTPTPGPAAAAAAAGVGGKEFDIRSRSLDPQTAVAAAKSKDKDTLTAVANLLPEPTALSAGDASTQDRGDAPPGHCTRCHDPFTLPTYHHLASHPTSYTTFDDAHDLDDDSSDRSRDSLVGFACGHIFHLSCLLPQTNASQDVMRLLRTQMGEGGETWGRGVGAKVAHAHVIRRAVGKGCVVCHAREGVGGADD